jgi:uncharacterized protein YbaR (Trm112 family)
MTGGPARSTEARTVETLDRKLLELLVCPLTKGPLRYDAAANELISERARLAYPIKSGVPLLTREAARPLSDETPSATPAR